MTTQPLTSPPAVASPTGRVFFLTGVGLCLLGVALVFVQFSLGWLFTPWYSPVLATLGAVFVLVSLARCRTLPRLAALLLVAAFAGLQWYALSATQNLPDYAGPAQPGKPIPAFKATLADGRPFTDADLHDGNRRVLVFFRGRW